MLVLSRGSGESLVIDKKITVRVVKNTGDYVTIGIDAPRQIRVLRGELRRREDAAPPVPVAADGQG